MNSAAAFVPKASVGVVSGTRTNENPSNPVWVYGSKPKELAMTNRGLFAILASTSIAIDVLTGLLHDHSRDMMIGAPIVLAITAIVIFGAARGYKVALVGLAVWFGLSIISSVSDFFPIEALRNVFEPGETIAIKMTNLFTLELLTAALAIYAKGRTV